MTTNDPFTVDNMVTGLIEAAEARQQLTEEDRFATDPRFGGTVVKPGSSEE